MRSLWGGNMPNLNALVVRKLTTVVRIAKSYRGKNTKKLAINLLRYDVDDDGALDVFSYFVFLCSY